MSIFLYTAAHQNGALVTGERESENEKTLAQALKSEGLFLLEARDKAKKGSLASLDVGAIFGDLISHIRPISLVDKMFFARNLAVMVEAGLSLTRALDALAQESTNQKFQKVISDINNAVIKGKAFAEALKPYEKIFGTLFIGMIEVGEATGKLGLVLKLLASQMKKDYNIRRRVKGAMFYPAVVITALLIVGTLMMVYVVPTLSQTLKELGATLPPTTQVIIFISDMIVNYSLWFGAGLVTLGILIWRILHTAQGKAIFDRMILKTPLFGPLFRKFNTARFCRTLAYLIASGVPIVRSLEITSGVLGNSLFKNAVTDASKEIQKGKQLNQILTAHHALFPPLVIQMIQVGEETGKISDMLLRLAMFFEEEVTNTTKNMSSIIEPVLMIVVGTAVGFFAVSMLQPIYGSLGNI